MKIKAAMEQAQQQMQRQMQNAQIRIIQTIHVMPGSSSRVILKQLMNETKVEIDLAMWATATSADMPLPGQSKKAQSTRED